MIAISKIERIFVGVVSHTDHVHLPLRLTGLKRGLLQNSRHRDVMTGKVLARPAIAGQANENWANSLTDRKVI